MSATTSRPSGLYLDGEWRSGASTFAVADKFTGEDVAAITLATLADVEAAIAGADRASRTTIPAAERSRILIRVAEILEERAASVVDDYVAETGFTISDAQNELRRTASVYRLSGHEALRIAGEEIPVASAEGSENRMAFTIRVPVGVVVAISPFNAPLSTVAHKIGPAIAAGNAVVLKPAEKTPLSAITVVTAFAEAGLPPGYLQLVCAPGRSISPALIGDERVRFYTFTGSTGVGRTIAAGAGLARTHLELGSNSASIVAADADLERAADLITRAGYRKAGQVCTSVQRVVVHRDRVEELYERLAEKVGALVAGDPRADGTDVGPLIDRSETDRAAGWVAAASTSGSRVVGGRQDGSILSPTLLMDPPAESNVLTREIFAPVVSLVPVASFEAAIELVNAGQYGLQTGVFTQDIDAAFRAARELRVGGVIVNDTSSYHADAMPYGGVKDSGHGVEGPKYAVHDMTDPRIIVLNLR